jgi:hypothetical protein
VLEPGTREHYDRVRALRKVLHRREHIERTLPGCAILPPALGATGDWEFRVDGAPPLTFRTGELLVVAIERLFPGVGR